MHVCVVVVVLFSVVENNSVFLFLPETLRWVLLDCSFCVSWDIILSNCIFEHLSLTTGMVKNTDEDKLVMVSLS